MMITKSWILGALTALATVSTSRSTCDDLEQYFGDVNTVSEISLDVTTIECPPNDDNEMLEEVLIESGRSLVITTTRDSVRFVNIRFTVEDGASLVFDLPETSFGPNSGDNENAPGFMLDVEEGGSATFTGTFRGSEVENVRSMFFNAGTMEFQNDAHFVDNGNVFRSNSGTLKFRGDTVFRDNSFLAIDNIDSGYVTFSKTVLFDDNAGAFDGADGCAVNNARSTGIVIFRDEATFENHSCGEGSAVSNSGKMRFFGHAIFNDNINFNTMGGGVNNQDGTLIFEADAQFNRNRAEQGGGISVHGGEVTFEKSVLFDANEAEITGGAISLTYDGSGSSLTFEKPNMVQTTDNTITRIEPGTEQCQLAFVEEGTTLVGFDFDDVCDAFDA